MEFTHVGTPIGFLAALSIGEPGTQLTMKNFQLGGVAGLKNLTSSFETVQSYLRLVDIAKRCEDGGEPYGYDYIAPVSGEIQTVSLGDGTKRLRIVTRDSKGNIHNKLKKRNVRVHEGVKLKKYVNAGDSVQEIQGDLNVNEIIKYRSVAEAKKYLAVFLYNIFQKEVYVSSKHFEVVVSAMAFKLCIKGKGYFKTGVFYTLQEYYAHNRDGGKFEDKLIGVNSAPKYRNDMLSGLFYEDQLRVTSRNILISGQDELKQPITRYTLGLNIGIGSDVEGYLEGR